MKKIGIIGHFALGKEMFDGQTVKTKMLYKELNITNLFDEINILDTYDWKHNKISLLKDTVITFIKCSDIIILLSQNGMRVFFPLIFYINKILKKRVHHVVIGGNLSNLIEKNYKWVRYLNDFDGNYVETQAMKEQLNNRGINNVSILPNFKRLNIINENDLIYEYNEPYKLCTFSRIMKEKGIEDAIKVVTEINHAAGRTVCELDIYGQIDTLYKEEFENIINNSDFFIKYKGIVPADKSVEILKNYYLLLFPTYFFGEGFPGTLIDAFSSGIPIIASNWKYNSEIINNGVNGLIYDRKQKGHLKKILNFAIENPHIINKMKINCIRKARDYSPEIALKTFIENLNKGE